MDDELTDFEFRSFLELLYSLAKQFCSWYDKNVKKG